MRAYQPRERGGGSIFDRIDDGSLSRLSFEHFSHISLKLGYFFRSTPKVASSSLLTTLHKLELEDRAFAHTPAGAVHDRGNSPLAAPAQVADIDALLDGELLRFCFVRNPVDRFISAYLDKVRPSGGGLGPMVAAAHGLPPESEVTIMQFAEVVAHQPRPDMDPHYSVQAWHLASDLIEYDLIGRFEHYDRDLAELGRRLGVDLASWESRIDHHWTGPKLYSHFLEPDLMAIIVQTYQEDFERFGYPTALAAYTG